MSQTQKSIAVLTSGGDAPGMNAAVRAVVRAGINKGMKVYGVYRGYNGLLNGDVEEMNLRSVSDIIGNGGTMLYTARSEEYATPAGIQRAADFCRSIGVSGVVVIGGDGSFRGARCLTNAGINCIGVPGTIDNDIACSEYTVGFDTAMNTAIQMVDRIRDTAQSHDRCSVVEVMGRRCGVLGQQIDACRDLDPSDGADGGRRGHGTASQRQHHGNSHSKAEQFGFNGTHELVLPFMIGFAAQRRSINAIIPHFCRYCKPRGGVIYL